MGKAIDTSSTQNPSPTPSSYVATIKSHVPITLDLQKSNYAKWRELFRVALDRYNLTNLVLGTTNATLLNTLPTSDWVRDDYMITPKSRGSL
jgi:hypothetical protein